MFNFGKNKSISFKTVPREIKCVDCGEIFTTLARVVKRCPKCRYKKNKSLGQGGYYE